MFGLAKVAFQRADRLKALRFVREALQYAPRSATYRTFEGEMLYGLGNVLGACETWHRALDAKPDSEIARARFARYCALDQTRSGEKAAPSLK